MKNDIGNTPYRVGAGKTNITCFKKGVAMNGYGIPKHVMKDVETQLYARSVVIGHGETQIAFVNVDLGMCTIYLKHGVVEMLQQDYPEMGFSDTNVMISAQHTHSAAGGYGQHFFYNVPTPGFHKDIYERYRDGIVQAIVLAHYRKRPARMRFGTGVFPETAEVAFNRSLEAYNANPEVQHPLSSDEWHLAADRRMKLVEFTDAADGRPICCVNWFGTHCTSISNDHYKICADNKGYAAEHLEKYYRDIHRSDTVCLFAQDACGDITPNFYFDKKKNWTRGKFSDDYQSGRYVGELQSHQAQRILDNLAESPTKRIEAFQSYFEFSEIHCDSTFTNGKTGCRTSQPSLGVSFLEGTVEGPGISKNIGNLLRRALDIHKRNELRWALTDNESYRNRIHLKYDTQPPKHIAIEGIRGKIAWYYEDKIPLPSFLEKTVANIKDAIQQRKTTVKPWIISRLPLQIFLLGKMAIVGIPTEITVIAAQRLRDSIQQDLADQGVEYVQLAPYSNAYAGYVTTPEEYMLQCYEGGHTLYGKWTLPAMQTAFRQMVSEWKTGELKDSRPLIFPEEDIWVYGNG